MLLFRILFVALFLYSLPIALMGQMIDSTLDPRITTNDTVNSVIKTVKGFDVQMDKAKVVNKKGMLVKNGFDKYYIHVLRIEFKNFKVKYKYKDTMRVGVLNEDLQDSSILNLKDTVILTPRQRRKQFKKAQLDSLKAKLAKADTAKKAKSKPKNELVDSVKKKPVVKDSAALAKDSIAKARAEAKKKRKGVKMTKAPPPNDSTEAKKVYAFIAVASLDKRAPEVDTILRSRALMIIGLVDNSSQMIKFIERKLAAQVNIVDSLKRETPQKLKKISTDTAANAHEKSVETKAARNELTDAKLQLKQYKIDLDFFRDFNRHNKRDKIVKYFLARYFLERNLKYNASTTPFGLPEIKYDEKKFGKITIWRIMKDFFKSTFTFPKKEKTVEQAKN